MTDEVQCAGCGVRGRWDGDQVLAVGDGAPALCSRRPPRSHGPWLPTTTEPDAVPQALFHWSPRARRGQILRHGLRPKMRPSLSLNDEGWRAPYVCFAETPSWAWALSGAMSYAPRGTWDLWQTSVDRLTDPEFVDTYDDHRWHEVRTTHRIYKRDLWWVGSRETEPDTGPRGD